MKGGWLGVDGDRCKTLKTGPDGLWRITMELNELVYRAASVYPDAAIMEYWDTETETAMPDADAGDLLAAFIASELADTYDPEACGSVQIFTAIRVLQTAQQELARVVGALQAMAVEAMAA